jgi:hypothetical protein
VRLLKISVTGKKAAGRKFSHFDPLLQVYELATTNFYILLSEDLKVCLMLSNAVRVAFGNPTFDHLYLEMFLIVCQEKIKLNLKIFLQAKNGQAKRK